MADEIIDDELEPKPEKPPFDKNGEPTRRSVSPAAVPFQFKPGQSGNPGGRPKSKPFRKAIEKYLKAADGDFPEPENQMERIAMNLVKMAVDPGTTKRNGKVKVSANAIRAIKEIADRIDGKAMPSPEELESNKGSKVVIVAPGASAEPSPDTYSGE